MIRRHACVSSAVRTLRAFCVVILSGARLGAQPAPALSESIIRRIDSTVSVYMAARHVPGLQLAVGIDRHLTATRAYGTADVENNVPVTTASRFRMASIGKPMTATAVMQLWEQGKLNLDAPIQRYCNAYPVKLWPVTARQLLAHTAGVRDKTPAEEINHHHFESVAASVQPFADDSLLAPPGTHFRYTSYGYNVLGCAIEGASGVPYLEYMNKAVFAPAGMQYTGLDELRGIIPNRVRGYALTDAGILVNSEHDDMSNRVPAGGFVSTAEDLVRFGSSYLTGALVRDSTRELMFRVPNGADGRPLEKGFYALGWGIFSWFGTLEVGHGGGTPQASALLMMLPSKRFVIAFMMNLEGPVPERMELAEDIATIVLGGAAPSRKPE